MSQPDDWDETAEREAQEQLARAASHSGLLAELSEYLAGATPDPGELLETVTRRVAAFLDATCLIRLVEEEAERLAPLVVHDPDSEILERARRSAAEVDVRSSLVGALRQDPRPQRFPSPEGTGLTEALAPEHRRILEQLDAGPALVIPLMAGDRVFGMLVVFRRETEEALDDHAFRLARELGRLIELAIRNAMLVASLRDELERREDVEQDLATRIAQQRTLVELSQRALEENDLPALLDAAVETVAATLDVPLAAVLELSPAKDRLLVRAGRGWPEGFVGHAQLGVGETIAGMALQRSDPVIVTGLEEDTAPDFDPVAEYAIESAITVLVTGRHAPYGVLGVYDRHPRSFDDRDAGFLRAVGNVIGSAIERFGTQRRFLQAQRMEAVGRIAGGIAHDFNNLLTIIIGYAEMLRPELTDPTTVADLDELREAADEAAELVDNLLTFSRRDGVETTDVLDVAATVVDLEPMLRRVVSERISLQVSVTDEGAAARIDPGELQQILLNLVINAGDAMPDGGEIAIRVDRREVGRSLADELGVQPGDVVSVVVSDTGTGMAPEVVHQATEPFFTTKPVGVGTGLGLSTVYGIVRGRDGTVRIDSQPGLGTAVSVLLPSRRASRPTVDPGEAEMSAPATGEPDTHGGTILLVEDEPSVRALTARALRERGYDVVEAENGADALDRAADMEQVDLLVTDVVMPNMTGPELATELRKDRPDLSTLYVSGYSDEELPFDGVFVSKPYRVDQLARTIGLLLERSRSPGSPRPSGAD